MEVELRRCGLQNFDLGMSVKGNTDCLPSRQGTRNPATTITYDRGRSIIVLILFGRIATMGSPLEGCVGSLRNSMQLLDSSINILTEGVNDFPRLARVLQTTRVSFRNVQSWATNCI
jgi:hypothetical protein